MNSKSYLKVGIFVILGAVIFVVAVVLFGGGKFFRDKYVIETYFDQSIQGLDVGSPLKFNGVQIGNVSEIHFVFNDYKTYKQYVLVRAEVFTDMVGGGGGRRIADEYENIQTFLDVLVNKGLRLELAPLGVTGLAFLNMVYVESGEFPAYDIDWQPRYPYIPSTPGTIVLITKALSELSTSINNIDFEEIGNQTEILLTQLANINYEEIDYRIQEVLTSLDDTLQTLDSTSKDIKRFTVTERAELQDMVRDMKVITEHIRQISATGKQRPGWLIFGKPPAKVNPGEK